MSINCLIIDDEPLAINVIKSYVEEINNATILNTFNSAIDALAYLKDHTVDLIFLDINMPILNGLDFIKNLETKPLIIVTTAYDEYAIKTYELDVLDYLVKPIPFPRFMKASYGSYRLCTKNIKFIIMVRVLVTSTGSYLQRQISYTLSVMMRRLIYVVI